MTNKHKDNAFITATGHVHIQDDLGTVHLDDCNAIHAQNLARIIARALANEENSHIYKMAFGNGGTIVDALFDVTLKTPNDGLYPDVATWTSRLYNETYAEIISDPNALSENNQGTSSINTVLSFKDANNPLQSKVRVTVVLGPDEPRTQSLTDNLPPEDVVNNTFTFDEIGLFSSGKSNVATQGRCDVDVRAGTTPDSITGLLSNTEYFFDLTFNDVDVSNPTYTRYTFNTNGLQLEEITYEVLVNKINDALPNGLRVTMIEPSTGAIDGFLKFISNLIGSGSNVIVKEYEEGDETEDAIALFKPNVLTTFQQRILVTEGSNAGVEDSDDPTLERERLLTHITFVPVIKAANRTFVITYTITINVG